MTIEDLAAEFERNDDEYGHAERVTDSPHRLRDVAAFILLDRLVPSPAGRRMVASAEHDEIWLQTDCKLLAEVATPEDVLTLVRLGVRYDDDIESLAMFV